MVTTASACIHALRLHCCAGQVCLLGMQLMWTRDVSEVLRKAETDRKLAAKMKQQIATQLNTVLGRVSASTSAIDRIKFESLATLQLYYKDTFDDLVSC